MQCKDNKNHRRFNPTALFFDWIECYYSFLKLVWKMEPTLKECIHLFIIFLVVKMGHFFGPLDTKNPPQAILRGILVEHRRIELLTF